MGQQICYFHMKTTLETFSKQKNTWRNFNREGHSMSSTEKCRKSRENEYFLQKKKKKTVFGMQWYHRNLLRECFFLAITNKMTSSQQTFGKISRELIKLPWKVSQMSVIRSPYFLQLSQRETKYNTCICRINSFQESFQLISTHKYKIVS